MANGTIGGEWIMSVTLYTSVLATVLWKAGLITEYVYDSTLSSFVFIPISSTNQDDSLLLLLSLTLAFGTSTRTFRSQDPGSSGWDSSHCLRSLAPKSD